MHRGVPGCRVDVLWGVRHLHRNLHISVDDTSFETRRYEPLRALPNRANGSIIFLKARSDTMGGPEDEKRRSRSGVRAMPNAPKSRIRSQRSGEQSPKNQGLSLTRGIIVGLYYVITCMILLSIVSSMARSRCHGTVWWSERSDSIPDRGVRSISGCGI